MIEYVRRTSNFVTLWRRPVMRNTRVFFAVALMAVSTLAFAQDSIKKGDKNWADLEKQLADINDSGCALISITRTMLKIAWTSRIRFGPAHFSRSACRGKLPTNKKGSKGRPQPPPLIRFRLEIPGLIRSTSS